MYHGAINHGGQLLDDALPPPAEHLLQPDERLRARVREPARRAPRKVGIIGLGAGALAVYARKGDTLPLLRDRSAGRGRRASSEFSFLEDSPAQTDIVLGDGRLSLEREPPQAYDVLAIDAFSGDSIPMHLLTREAMATYSAT